ncbi:MAG: hypothetical protein E6230_24390 [Paenibacillus dendritiformis]|nr:hypothetical protein [uncultured Paenibacillus sp.]MDU5145322.1 hypothetical protein [Paenibacillus dendritiformis]
MVAKADVQADVQADADAAVRRGLAAASVQNCCKYTVFALMPRSEN